MTQPTKLVPLALLLACGGKTSSVDDDTGEVESDTGTENLDTGEEETEDPEETCNGRDDDGDGLVDEGMWGLFWHPDTADAWTVGPGVASVTRSIDEWSNGDFDEETTDLYNTSGQIFESTTTYTDPDTTGETTTYSYNEDGALTSKRTEDDTGRLISELKNTWDNGLLIEAQFFAATDAGEEYLTLSYSYEYDAEGYVSSRSEDSDGDGEVNNITWTTWSADHLERTDSYYVVRLDTDYMVIRTTYSPTGKMLLVETDTDASGTWDNTITYTYDDEDRLVEVAWAYGGGEPSALENYEYDGSGRLLWVYQDMDADGEADDAFGRVWEGNSLIEYIEDDDAGGEEEAQTTWRFTLDPAGNTATSIEDPDDHTSTGTHTTVHRFICY
jgi:YD repeat-containing protein